MTDDKRGVRGVGAATSSRAQGRGVGFAKPPTAEYSHVDVLGVYAWGERVGALDVNSGLMNYVWATESASIAVHQALPTIFTAYPHVPTLVAIDARQGDDNE